jgi:hypothetical protein
VEIFSFSGWENYRFCLAISWATQPIRDGSFSSATAESQVQMRRPTQFLQRTDILWAQNIKQLVRFLSQGLQPPLPATI